MQIKLFVSAAAIALVAGVGSASAADQFQTLEGIAADALTPQEMGVVIGSDGDKASLHITASFTFDGGCGMGCHHFVFPGAAGASDVVSMLPGDVVPAMGSDSNNFVPKD